MSKDIFFFQKNADGNWESTTLSGSDAFVGTDNDGDIFLSTGSGFQPISASHANVAVTSSYSQTSVSSSFSSTASYIEGLLNGTSSHAISSSDSVNSFHSNIADVSLHALSADPIVGSISTTVELYDNNSQTHSIIVTSGSITQWNIT
jgi:hypothetical protein